MSQKIFRVLFALVIVAALVIRILPARGNNFYFTTDQGNDAVYVREILERHQLLLKGPETGIENFFAGPFWYYFIGAGYLLFNGHPFGAVFMLIILNVATVAYLMLRIAKNISKPWAILVGAALQFFWWFYDASRYGFNPFPLVSLSILILLFLTNAYCGKRHYFTLAAIPVALAFHTEVAGAVAFLLFYLAVALLMIAKRRINLGNLATGFIILVIFFLPFIFSEISHNFSQTEVLARQLREPSSVLNQRRFDYMTLKFKEMIGESTFAQNTTVGTIIFAFTLIFAFYRQKQLKKTSLFAQYFAILSTVLVIISWLWFSATRGWQTWHTVYVQPIIFLSVLLIFSQLIYASQKHLKIIPLLALVTILFSQLLYFKNLYFQFFKPFEDPSLLVNELAAVDWVYQKSAGLGFYVYTYLPSVEDYNYQYLIWWHGRNTYGYLPCEYSTFPNVPDFFVPGVKHYQQPQKPCSNLRFLIIEPDQNTLSRQTWLDQVQKGTELDKRAKFGSIEVEALIW